MESHPRVAKSTKVVLPAAPKEEEAKFGSSSTWKRQHLKLLGAKFYAKTKLDLNRILGVTESEWSPANRERNIFFSGFSDIKRSS